VMHFLFSLLRIKGLYMFRALIAHPQEAFYKRNLVYCLRVMTVGCISIRVAAIFRAKLFHVQYPTFSTAVTLHNYSPLKMAQIVCSETLEFKLQTPGNNPEKA
jgi:hypothetical protein